MDEFLLGIIAGVDLGEGAQLGVGAEDQVDVRGGSFHLAGGAVANLIDAVVCHRFSFVAHVEQVDEEVVSQNARTIREDAVRRFAMVRA